MRKRYTEEQIIGILNESQAGAQTGDLVRRHGISRQTFYRWRQKYGESLPATDSAAEDVTEVIAEDVTLTFNRDTLTMVRADLGTRRDVDARQQP